MLYGQVLFIFSKAAESSERIRAQDPILIQLCYLKETSQENTSPTPLFMLLSVDSRSEGHI